MREQPLQAQKGEIEFRKKLVRQHVGGVSLFEDEFSASEMEDILKNRMAATYRHMTSLQRREIRLSPYVEIGAERGQRSLVMENEIGANGAAIDISFDMLKSCDHYSAVFKKPQIPLRVCCDVNYLPFLSDSVPFVFCYQFLHHFPDPEAVTKEVYRILAPGGRFFFDEEPYKKRLHINLYNRKLYSKKTMQRSNAEKALDFFFAREVNNENEYGVIENDTITLRRWKNALKAFAKNEVKASTVHRISSDVFNPESVLNHLIASLCGGNISGLCQKSGTPNGAAGRNIEARLVCPSCLVERRESAVKTRGLFFTCDICAKKYPVIDGILFLFPYERFAALYPEQFKTIGQ